ncbi:hypothetical protein E2542_SST04671 [Spatholobus suberectus]|nr:hypothetical protein E2542_SST04671 [Spatholobus suberectus]
MTQEQMIRIWRIEPLTTDLKTLSWEMVSDTSNHHKFQEEMKKIMLAIADRLGSFPLRRVLKDNPNSLLQKAVDLEASTT